MQKGDSTWVPDDVLKLLIKRTLQPHHLLPRLPAWWEEMKNPYCLSHFYLDILLLTVENTLIPTATTAILSLWELLPRLLSAFPHSSPSLQTHITSEPTVWMHGSLMRSPARPPSTHCQPQRLPHAQRPPQIVLPGRDAVKPLPRCSTGVTSMHVVSVRSRCCHKWPQTWWLTTIEMYSLTSWRPEIQSQSRCQNQGVSRVALPLEALGKNPFLVSSTLWWLPAFLGLWLHHSSHISESLICLYSTFRSICM